MAAHIVERCRVKLTSSKRPFAQQTKQRDPKCMYTDTMWLKWLVKLKVYPVLE